MNNIKYNNFVKEDKMLNIIWPLFIIISFIYGIFAGRVNEINNEIFNSLESAVQLSITFLGTICLWTGIMKIASSTTLIKRLSNALKPIMKFLFPDIKENDKEHKEISMNIVANLLGLGNAATPLGLKAMSSMQEKNKNKTVLTNSMAMLIVLNTASLEIVPTTVIAIRSSLESENPTSIIVPVWIVTILSCVSVIIATIILSRKFCEVI